MGHLPDCQHLIIVTRPVWYAKTYDASYILPTGLSRQEPEQNKYIMSPVSYHSPKQTPIMSRDARGDCKYSKRAHFTHHDLLFTWCILSSTFFSRSCQYVPHECCCVKKPDIGSPTQPTPPAPPPPHGLRGETGGGGGGGFVLYHLQMSTLKGLSDSNIFMYTRRRQFCLWCYTPVWARLSTSYY
jgi:hypothetical protein